MDKGYLLLEIGLSMPQFGLSRDDRVRILSYLSKRVDQFVTNAVVPAAEVIPVEYLGRYPALGIVVEEAVEASEERYQEFSNSCRELSRRLRAHVESVGVERLRDLAADETLTWGDVLASHQR